MGGEKLRVALWRLDTRGSPPRGRGKGFSCGCCPGIEGITPAWAGKRYLRGSLPLACADHPRVGGEKAIFHPLLTIPKGSPPRGRGKAPTAGRWVQGTRITPAWAGKRKPPPDDKAGGGDHPRVGGEKPAHDLAHLVAQGSPPRGRGKGGNLPGRVRADGITPAWAGKRLFPWPVGALGGDHPRVGGEKTKKIP